jgi:phosphatidylserine synthase
MLDDRMRPVKDRLLGPLARILARRFHPNVLSVGGMVASLAAAGFIVEGRFGWALGCWGISRLLDGVDGVVARLGEPSDFGGALDLLLDGVGYVAIPLAFGISAGTLSGWIVVAVLLATFYLNALSWSTLATVMARREARAQGARRPSGPGIPLPRGLVEGTETVVLYTLAMMLPGFALWIFSLMASLVVLTVVERIVHARRILGAQ